jgi:hypothetical protein
MFHKDLVSFFLKYHDSNLNNMPTCRIWFSTQGYHNLLYNSIFLYTLELSKKDNNFNC